LLQVGMDQFLKSILQKSYYKDLSGKNPLWKANVDLTDLMKEI